MKLLKYLLLLLALPFLFLSGCQKEDPCPEIIPDYYYLSAQDSAKLPYTGTDTLIFSYGTGNNAPKYTYIGQGKAEDIDYDWIYEDYNSPECLVEEHIKVGYRIKFVAQESGAPVSQIVFMVTQDGVFEYWTSRFKFKNKLSNIENETHPGYIAQQDFDGNIYEKITGFDQQLDTKYYYNAKYGLLRIEFYDDGNILQIVP